MAQENYFPISEISTYLPRGWAIKARVTRKGAVRTWSGNRPGKAFDVDLLDAAGGEIRASFFNAAVDAFNDILVMGKCYVLKSGNVRVADRRYNQCNHRYALTFDQGAVVQESTEDSKIETVKFNFVNLRALQAKSTPCIVDICGIITSFKQLQPVPMKDGQQLIKRELTVADDTAHSMTITIWNDKAKQNDSVFEAKPVLAFKGVAVKEWNSGRAGSLTFGGVMDFNASVPEVQRLREWWKQGGEKQDFNKISREGGGGGVRQTAKDATLALVRAASQEVMDQPDFFNVVTRLTLVQFRKKGEKAPLTYMACQEQREGSSLLCQCRLDDKGFCNSCGRTGKAAPRLNLRCRFADSSDVLWLTTFHESAETILGRSAKEVHEEEVSGAHEAVERSVQKRFFSDPWQVTVRAKVENYMGERRTGLSCVGAQPVNMNQHGRKMAKDITELLGVAL